MLRLSLINAIHESETLKAEEWQKRAGEHAACLEPWADAFAKRRSLGQTHPVHDFLFTYYTFSPLKLKQWVPAYHQTLILPKDPLKESYHQCLKAYPWLKSEWFNHDDEKLSVNPSRIKPSTLYLLDFISKLCRNISRRAPRFGCYGLHEWAMVYRSTPEQIRHSGYRLRLSPEALARFVESQTLCCTHYDAYRFFTREAQPLNLYKPSLDNRLQFEQGGCLHANMDLYKWATKLWPWIGSDFIEQAFLLAIEGRELDMRASPYDLKREGYDPIKIETEEGRAEYQEQQKVLAEKAALLRNRLELFCEGFQQFIRKHNPNPAN